MVALIFSPTVQITALHTTAFKGKTGKLYMMKKQNFFESFLFNQNQSISEFLLNLEDIIDSNSCFHKPAKKIIHEILVWFLVRAQSCTKFDFYFICFNNNLSKVFLKSLRLLAVC